MLGEALRHNRQTTQSSNIKLNEKWNDADELNENIQSSVDLFEVMSV